MTLEKAIEQYAAYDLGITEDRGGYPAEIEELNGVIAIAKESDIKGVDLDLYEVSSFIKWMSDAKAYITTEGCDLVEAVNETMAS